MNSKLTQAIGAFGGPLLTLVCTSVIARYVTADEPKKAAGAALAGLLGFALVQVAEELPKRWQWWRLRFDSRAVFEGWWIQVHEDRKRAAILSFRYDGSTNKYSVHGHAFDDGGEHLANWQSTEVFFSTGNQEINYLWKGTSYDKENEGQREGSSRFALDWGPTRRRPVTGFGEVQHLNLNRVLEFRMRRITPQFLKDQGVAFSVDDLADFDIKREFAKALLRARNGTQKRMATQ